MECAVCETANFKKKLLKILKKNLTLNNLSNSDLKHLIFDFNALTGQTF